MANGFKTGGRDFRPGTSGNVHGRPPLPEEFRGVAKLSPSFVRLAIAKLVRMTREELAAHVRGESISNLEVMIAAIIEQAIVEGNHAKLEFLLSRSIGRVPDVEVAQLQSIVYRTTVRGDGALLQEVLDEDLRGDHFG